MSDMLIIRHKFEKKRKRKKKTTQKTNFTQQWSLIRGCLHSVAIHFIFVNYIAIMNKLTDIIGSATQFVTYMH